MYACRVDISTNYGMIKYCKRCQAETERNAGGSCKHCAKAYREAHTDRAKEANTTWREANPERVKAKNAARYLANPERAKAAAVAWQKDNQERFKEYSVAYRAENRERLIALSTAWQKANPEAKRICDQNRRARKLDNGGKLSKGLSAKLFKLQKGKCPCCQQPLGNDFHLDHIMPLKKGGANDDWNIQLLRQQCNQQKSAKDPIDFMQSRGFLL